MSSDNGIYVLVSPTENSQEKEYRVAYRFAIDSLDYFPEGSLEYAAMEVVYFGEAKVYDTEEKALEAAVKIENGEYTEYGICILPIRPKPFSKMSFKEAEELTK